MTQSSWWRAWRVDILLFLMLLALVGYQQSLRAQQRNLRDRIVAAHQQTYEQQNQLRKDATILAVAEHYRKDTSAEIKDLLQRFASSSFPKGSHGSYTSGPYIVWSEVASQTKSKRFACYLPAGEHHLKYAAIPIPAATEAAPPRQRIGSTSGIAVGSYELKDGPLMRFYEFVLHSDGRLFVMNRNRVAKQVLILTHLPGEYELSAVESYGPFAYPSEVRAEDLAARPAQDSGLRPFPATNLFSVIATGPDGERFDIRLWIESDAPPFMSASEVAHELEKYLSWEEEVAGLFQPYYGGDRVFFREGIFARGAGF